MTRAEIDRLKAERLAAYRKEGRSKQWITSWKRGWDKKPTRRGGNE